MTHGSELRTPTKAEEILLAVTERAMERRMLRVSLYDHITLGVKDTVMAAREYKLR